MGCATAAVSSLKESGSFFCKKASDDWPVCAASPFELRLAEFPISAWWGPWVYCCNDSIGLGSEDQLRGDAEANFTVVQVSDCTNFWKILWSPPPCPLERSWLVCVFLALFDEQGYFGCVLCLRRFRARGATQPILPFFFSFLLNPFKRQNKWKNTRWARASWREVIFLDHVDRVTSWPHVYASSFPPRQP